MAESNPRKENTGAVSKVGRSMSLKSWDIIVFPEENSVSYVPSCWAVGKEKYLYTWPDLKSQSKLELLLSEEAKKYVEKYLGSTSSTEHHEFEDEALNVCGGDKSTTKYGEEDSTKSDNFGDDGNDDDDGTVLRRKIVGAVQGTVEKQSTNSRSPPTITPDYPDYTELSSEFGSLAHSSTETSVSSREFNAFARKQDQVLHNISKIVVGIEFEMKKLREELGAVAISNTNISQNRSAAVQLIHTFPIDCDEKLEEVEEKLKNPEIFGDAVGIVASAGGKDLSSAISNAMKKVFNREMSTQFSAVGRKGKKNFSSLVLYKVVVEAVKRHYPDATENVIRGKISAVLATSADREGGRKSRNKKNEESITEEPRPGASSSKDSMNNYLVAMSVQ